MKLGNNDITIKLGSVDVDSIYLGTQLVYSGGSEPPTPTPTLQWVSFANGDDISGLDIYGVSGVAIDLQSTFENGGNILFLPSRTNVECSIGGIGGCYGYTYSQNDNVELIFSDLGTCNDYYNSDATTVGGGTIQLYVYA